MTYRIFLLLPAAMIIAACARTPAPESHPAPAPAQAVAAPPAKPNVFDQFDPPAGTTAAAQAGPSPDAQAVADAMDRATDEQRRDREAEERERRRQRYGN